MTVGSSVDAIALDRGSFGIDRVNAADRPEGVGRGRVENLAVEGASQIRKL